MLRDKQLQMIFLEWALSVKTVDWSGWSRQCC